MRSHITADDDDKSTVSALQKSTVSLNEAVTSIATDLSSRIYTGESISIISKETSVSFLRQDSSNLDGSIIATKSFSGDEKKSIVLGVSNITSNEMKDITIVAATMSNNKYIYESLDARAFSSTVKIEMIDMVNCFACYFQFLCLIVYKTIVLLYT